MKIRIILLIVMLGMSSQGSAVFQTGNDLLSNCESKNGGERDFCHYYLMGLTDTVVLHKHYKLELNRQYCLPSDVTTGQLRKVFTKFANGNPEVLRQAASGLVYASFVTAFPCE